MFSTWRDDQHQWRPQHYFLDRLDAYATEAKKPVPVFAKSEKVPYLTGWSTHRFILLHAAWPILLHHTYTTYTGQSLNALAASLLYTAAFQFNVLHEVWILRRLAHVVGFLDGDKHKRDDVPDVGVGKTLFSVLFTTTARPLLTVFFAYKQTETISLTYWLPVELALYSILLDLFFYSYHRAMHEVPWLWRFHRTHHLTRHPITLLSAYADAEQETVEITLIPILTFTCLRLAGFPMGFHDWWICHAYLIFTESVGHSGLRMYSAAPGTAWILLRPFGCELSIEDHDLHHRKGWRHSQNYGKQTLLWDRVFGTVGRRIETVDENIDFGKKVVFPVF